MEKALMARLLAAAGLTSLVSNRVYWVIAPQGVAAPYIIMSVISSVPGYTMAGKDALTESRVQVDIYAKTYASAKAISAQVKSALSGFRGGVSGVTFDGIFIASERDTFTDDASPSDLLGVSIDLMVWNKET
ncbi:MAG TPA: DUF3168 domain-containing protein [Aestuariivirga sp.]|nr:DUF3168 domain-containing protein [Aestuariivirga sp.]